MDITLLHAPLSAASRRFLASLGVTIPEGTDVTVTIGGDTVRVVSGHDACVAVCPAFSGYPAAVVVVDGQQYVLDHPSTWDEVTAWAANPAPAKPTTMTKYEFSKRFKADEMIGILAVRLTDPVVGLFLQLLDYAQDVDIMDVNIQSAMDHLVLTGKLTQDRATVILTP